MLDCLSGGPPARTSGRYHGCSPRPRPRACHNCSVKRSGIADLPLHGGRVPAWLATRMARSAAPSRNRSSTTTDGRRLLARLSDPFWFQALGSRHGHGLAFVRHHDVGDGRAEEGPQPEGRRAGHLHLRRPRQAVAAARRRNCATSPTGSGSTATRWCAPAGSRRASTTTPSPTASRSICTRSSSRPTATGRSCSRA